MSVEGEERALKLFENAAGYEAVRREIGALRKVHHPHVVKVYWADKTDQRRLVSHHRVHRGRVARRVRERQAAPTRSRSRSTSRSTSWTPSSLSIQTRARLDELDAEATGRRPVGSRVREWQELQEKGLVHRDIKPLNVMLTRNGRKAPRLQHRLSSRRPGSTRSRARRLTKHPTPTSLAGMYRPTSSLSG